MRLSGRGIALRRFGQGALHGVTHQIVKRHRRVGHAVHEGAVRPVFQQATHQIGQQGLMGAHRRIDAARPMPIGAAHHLPIQGLPHAVQALEFVLAGLIGTANFLAHLHDGRHRVRVVGGELRIHRVGCGQQLAGTGQVGHIRVVLACVDRVVDLTIDLRALDLAVPVGALDQAHHHTASAAARQVHDEVDHEGAALAVGLHHEAHALPAAQAGRGAQRLQDVQRQVQAIGFLGIDVQADAVVARQFGQAQYAREQLTHHTAMLCPAVARMQGRQLDRDARARDHAFAGRGRSDRSDRMLIGGQVAPRIAVRECGLAQHVVGIGKAQGLHLTRTLQGLLDGLAGDELFAQHLHGQLHPLADQGLAALAHQPGQGPHQLTFMVGGHQLARQQQPPRSGIHEQRRAMAHMLLPVTAADLVADQGVTRGGVWDAQQRLGQAHQGHAFLARQRELLHQALDPTGAPAQCRAFAKAAHQLPGHGIGTGRRLGALPGLCQQTGHGLLLGQPRGASDGFSACAPLP